MMRRLLSRTDLRLRLGVLLVAALLWIPLGGMPLWRHVFGFVGEVTPATWLLFFAWLGFPDVYRQWLLREWPLQRRIWLLIGMALFYVLTLGSWAFDPYADGYQPWALLGGLVVWVIWRGRQAPGITLLLGFDLALFGLHALLSDNLWDYLVDPILMFALGISVFRGVMSRRFKSH